MPEVEDRSNAYQLNSVKREAEGLKGYDEFQAGLLQRLMSDADLLQVTDPIQVPGLTSRGVEGGASMQLVSFAISHSVFEVEEYAAHVLAGCKIIILKHEGDFSVLPIGILE